MALRPQTLYALADSPVGLAAWILDHDDQSYALIDARIRRTSRRVSRRDDILDNITLYWLTNTAVSSARLYWDHSITAKEGFFDAKGVKIPVAVTAFPTRSIPHRGAGPSRRIPSSLLQQASQRHSLRRVGAAAILLRGSSRGLQTTAQTNLKTSARALCVPTSRIKRNCDIDGTHLSAVSAIPQSPRNAYRFSRDPLKENGAASLASLLRSCGVGHQELRGIDHPVQIIALIAVNADTKTSIIEFNPKGCLFG